MDLDAGGAEGGICGCGCAVEDKEGEMRQQGVGGVVEADVCG